LFVVFREDRDEEERMWFWERWVAEGGWQNFGGR